MYDKPLILWILWIYLLRIYRVICIKPNQCLISWSHSYRRKLICQLFAKYVKMGGMNQLDWFICTYVYILNVKYEHPLDIIRLHQAQCLVHEYDVLSSNSLSYHCIEIMFWYMFWDTGFSFSELALTNYLTFDARCLCFYHHQYIVIYLCFKCTINPRK